MVTTPRIAVVVYAQAATAKLANLVRLIRNRDEFDAFNDTTEISNVQRPTCRQIRGLSWSSDGRLSRRSYNSVN